MSSALVIPVARAKASRFRTASRSVVERTMGAASATRKAYIAKTRWR